MNPRKIYPLEDGEGHKDGEGLLELPSLYYTLPKDCLYLRVILWNIAGPTYLFYFLTINTGYFCNKKVPYCNCNKGNKFRDLLLPTSLLAAHWIGRTYRPYLQVLTYRPYPHIN
nr:hypothetical protein Q903MT_gene3601 [Picea sitchensis]